MARPQSPRRPGLVASDHFAPDPEVSGWIGRAPLAGVVVVLGLALSVFAWLGLRSVESSEGDLVYERALLAQSSELQGEIQGYLEAMDGLSATLALSETPTNTVLRNQISLFVPSGERQALQGLAIVELIRSAEDEDELLGREARLGNATFGLQYEGESSRRPNAILTRVFGIPGVESSLGRDLSSNRDLGELIERSLYSERSVVATSGVATSVFAAIGDESIDADRPSIIIATPIRRTGGVSISPGAVDWSDVDALLLGRVLLDDLIGGMRSLESSDSVALELRAGGVLLASTLPPDDESQAYGDPVNFTEGNLTWAIQGFEGGRKVDHRASWFALITGLVLAVTGGLFATSARRHAITLGRLETSEFDARHDALTGLLNRAGLTESLESALTDRRSSSLVAVLFLDLDRLKVVNDSIGHSAGDEVLVHVARRLDSITRDEDIVGRFGGDEFVMVAPGLQSVADVTAVAERILAAFREPAILSDESSQVMSTSIGISYVASGAGEDAESMLRDADLAMYRAKEAGGCRYEVFDAELRAQAVARLEVERELRRAIRTGQLVVHYQPIVDLKSGKVDRLEALVRWQHPERGMVAPGHFLSVAAESGLIVDVGEHVLREACRQAALWTSIIGRPICVSVNVAERQLLDNSLLFSVKRVLAETGIDPAQLELEITEELIVEKLDRRLSILRELDDMGLKLAIDDFGTSRASLSQLKSLDMVSTLKIDRAFVIDVATDSVDRKIITAIVALAESMGMEIVAEGVEDEDQVAVLSQLGVDFIQGFYFHRPSPSEQIVGVLQKSFEVPAQSELV